MSKQYLAAAVSLAIFAAPAIARAAETYAEFDEVEVLDVDNDIWDKCTVLAAYPGAYRVMCNYLPSLRRDIHVRAPGGEPAESGAQAVSGPPFKKNDIVLASIRSMPNEWSLCIVLRNDVAKSNNYLLDCGTDYRVQPKWVRKDPKAP